MEYVVEVLVVLHFVGLALLLGAFLVQVRSTEKTVTHWMWDGAMLQLLTGLLMVALVSAGALGDDLTESVDNAKFGVKLAIAVVLVVLSYIGKRRPAPQVPLWATIGLLTMANVVIAVFW
jgi:hypothetical protein